MTINCNVIGSERKRLAQVLGAILLFEPVYTKAPTFAYVVDDYIIDKIGTISCPDSATPETVAQIIAKLTDEGFTPEISGDETHAEIPTEMPDVAPEAPPESMPDLEATEANVGTETPDTAAEPEADPPTEEASGSEGDHPVENTTDESNTEANAHQDEPEIAEEDETKLTVSIPRDKLPDDALARLRMMVSNKAELFKRALLTDDLPIEVSEDKVSFPWFTLTGMAGEGEAYAQFITYLCKMAVEQTRVLNKPYDGGNDRFAMRIFMVRLGMKGAQFALARKLMMKKLTGNSGWRYGTPPKKTRGTPVAPADEPETPAYNAPSDVKAVEISKALASEEVPDTAGENISADGESVTSEVLPASDDVVAVGN